MGAARIGLWTTGESIGLSGLDSPGSTGGRHAISTRPSASSPALITRGQSAAAQTLGESEWTQLAAFSSSQRFVASRRWQFLSVVATWMNPRRTLPAFAQVGARRWLRTRVQLNRGL